MIVTGMDGLWYRLPSGSVAEVCSVTAGDHPEVILRKLNDDGAMAAGEFVTSLAFLLLHARRLPVAPAPTRDKKDALNFVGQG